MKGAALRKDEFVDVSKLFQFTRDQVEQLAKDIGGVQQPVISAPKNAASFDLGRLTKEDKAKVPLRTVRPLFLRSSFQDAEELDDVLELAKHVDAVLNDTSARGRNAPLVFVDARGFPGAYRLAGLYTVKGDEVVAKVRLSKGKAKRATFSVTGTKTDLDALAKRIVAEAQRRLK